MTNLFYAPKNKETYSAIKFLGREYFKGYFPDDNIRNSGYNLAIQQLILTDYHCTDPRERQNAYFELGVGREDSEGLVFSIDIGTGPFRPEPESMDAGIFSRPLSACRINRENHAVFENEFIPSPLITTENIPDEYFGGPIMMHFDSFEELSRVKCIYFLVFCMSNIYRGTSRANQMGRFVNRALFIVHRISYKKPCGNGMNIYGLSSYLATRGTGVSFGSFISDQKTKKKMYYADVPEKYDDDACMLSEDSRELLESLWKKRVFDGKLLKIIPGASTLRIEDTLCYESSAELYPINLAELGSMVFQASNKDVLFHTNPPSPDDLLNAVE